MIRNTGVQEGGREMVLMIGHNRAYLAQLAEALSLPVRRRVIVTTRRGLTRVLANPERITLVLIDLFWKSPRNSLISIDSALPHLKMAGYNGKIDVCAYNPTADLYLSRLLKYTVSHRSVWSDVVDEDHPDLNVEQVAEKLAPLFRT